MSTGKGDNHEFADLAAKVRDWCRERGPWQDRLGTKALQGTLSRAGLKPATLWDLLVPFLGPPEQFEMIHLLVVEPEGRRYLLSRAVIGLGETCPPGVPSVLETFPSGEALVVLEPFLMDSGSTAEIAAWLMASLSMSVSFQRIPEILTNRTWSEPGLRNLQALVPMILWGDSAQALRKTELELSPEMAVQVGRFCVLLESEASGEAVPPWIPGGSGFHRGDEPTVVPAASPVAAMGSKGTETSPRGRAFSPSTPEPGQSAEVVPPTSAATPSVVESISGEIPPGMAVLDLGCPGDEVDGALGERESSPVQARRGVRSISSGGGAPSMAPAGGSPPRGDPSGGGAPRRAGSAIVALAETHPSCVPSQAALPESGQADPPGSPTPSLLLAGTAGGRPRPWAPLPLSMQPQRLKNTEASHPGKGWREVLVSLPVLLLLGIVLGLTGLWLGMGHDPAREPVLTDPAKGKVWVDAVTRRPITEQFLLADKEYRMGEIQRLHQRYNDALSFYRAAVAADRTHLEALDRIGYCLYKANDYVAAEAALKLALKQDPKFFRSHFYLGRIYREEQKWKEALEEFRQAFAGNAVLPIIGKEYGELLVQLGYFEEAREHYQRLKRMFPTDVTILQTLDQLPREGGTPNG